MVTGPVIGGSGLAGAMTFTAVLPAVMLKLMVSAPAVSFASWMAARNVHWFPLLDDTSHAALVRFRSGKSPMRLTVNVVAASAGPAKVRTAPTETATATRVAVNCLKLRDGISFSVLMALA